MIFNGESGGGGGGWVGQSLRTEHKERTIGN